MTVQLRPQNNILQLIVDKHAPRKQSSRSKKKQFSKPWITNRIYLDNTIPSLSQEKCMLAG